MKKKYDKITLIGAGSTVFGPAYLYSIFKEDELRDFTLALVDVDAKKLQIVHNMAEKLNEYFGRDIEIISSTDRREVLAGSDFVLISCERKLIELWKKDIEIVNNHGIELTFGECRGPCGLSKTLRTVPLVLDICRDVEELAPGCVVLNMTNPSDRVAYAIRKYTDLDVIGFCDGHWGWRKDLGKLMNIPPEEIHMMGAGINHMVWITKLIDKRTGENLYPKMDKKAENTGWQPFSRHLYKLHGLWPYESDIHIGEYIGYAVDFCEGYYSPPKKQKEEDISTMWNICTGGYKKYHESHEKLENKIHKRNVKLTEGEYNLEKFVNEIKDHHWEIYGDNTPIDIVKGYLGENMYMDNLLIPNHDKIFNLPEDMVVELPGIATPAGVYGISTWDLPESIISILYREGVVQKLSAEAAVEGSRKKALKAMILDDIVPNPQTAEDLLDSFLETHKEYMSNQFE